MNLVNVTQGQIGGRPALVVDARELHRALGVASKYADWINARIQKYGFVEGEDYEVFLDSQNNPSGGRPLKRHDLCLDMGKELAMVENNEFGRQVRRYFMECERRLREGEVHRGLPARAAVPPRPAPVRLPNGGRLLVTRHVERLALEMFVNGQDLAAIGRALGISRATASLVVHGKYQFSPAAGAPECSRELIAAVAERHLVIEQARLADYHQRLANRLRHTAHNQPLAAALDHVGRQLQQHPARAMLATPDREG